MVFKTLFIYLFLIFLLLFNYSCVPFLPIPPLQPSGTPLPPPPPPSPLIWSMCPLKTLFIFKERGGEGERVRETSPLTRPLLGTWPTTQACALTGNQTGDLLVLRLALSPLSNTSQGYLFKIFFTITILIESLKSCEIGQVGAFPIPDG